MQINLTFLSVIDILSIATSFMLGLLFITVKSKNKKANIFLGLFLLSLTIEIYYSLSDNFIHEVGYFIETSLFTIVFLMLYVNQTINNNYKKWYVLLFVPGIILNVLSNFNIETNQFMFLEYILNGGLLLFILKILKKHKNNINNYYSDLECKTLSWMKAIVFIFLGFHLFWIIEDIVGFQNETYGEYFADTSTILTFFMVYWIGYNGFAQSEIFKTKQFFSIVKSKEIDKITPNVLSETNEKFVALKVIIESEKLFVNQDLNLQSLSKILQIKEKQLSRLINIHSKTNFYQFINRFRVEEFKKLIQSPKAEQLSIFGLAQEAGFYSKSTFYSAFKSIEGMTPKEYKSSLKQSE